MPRQRHSSRREALRIPFDVPAPDLIAPVCRADDSAANRLSRRLTARALSALASLHYVGKGEFTDCDFSASGHHYRHTRRELDSRAVLQFNRVRYYDPRTGRWASQDPLGLNAGDSNLYRYVKNRPTQLTDPKGTAAVPLSAIIGDAGNAFACTIYAGGRGSWDTTKSNGEDSSQNGVVVKVVSEQAKDITIFQVIRQEILVRGKKGEGYLDMRAAAKSGGQPTLIYINPPDKPVWGLDAPSDRSRVNTENRRGDDYVTMWDAPATDTTLFESFGKDFEKHCVLTASSKTFVRTFVQYKDTLEGEVDWESSADYDGVKGFPGYNIVTVNDFRFNGYRITYVGSEKKDSGQFLKLKTEKDTNTRTNVLEKELEAM